MESKKNKKSEFMKEQNLKEIKIGDFIHVLESMGQEERKEFLKNWEEERNKDYILYKKQMLERGFLTKKEAKLLDNPDMHDIFQYTLMGEFERQRKIGDGNIALISISEFHFKHKKFIEEKFKIKIVTPAEAHETLKKEHPRIAKKIEAQARKEFNERKDATSYIG